MQISHIKIFCFQFGNPCNLITPYLSFLSDSVAESKNKAFISVQTPGVYSAVVTYDGEPLRNTVVLVVLSGKSLSLRCFGFCLGGRTLLNGTCNVRTQPCESYPNRGSSRFDSNSKCGKLKQNVTPKRVDFIDRFI